MKRVNGILATAAVVALLFSFVAIPASAANVVLVNLDPPGTGLNDPTPVAPVGGNPGTTLGQQRINVYNEALQIWGSTLASDVPIFVGATFQPLPCSPTGAVLGAAGATYVFSDFSGAEFADTWYHSALADALAGVQLVNDIDVISFFNSDIDDDPNCLVGRNWYYGLNNDEGTDIDFLTVVVHEINHGIGHQNFANESTGTLFLGRKDIYTLFTEDLTTGKTWDEMTVAERQASAVNDLNVVWNGSSVTSAAPDVLAGQAQVRFDDPDDLGPFEGQRASFGPSIDDGDSDSEATVVLAQDGVGVSTDACEPIANDVAGAIALIDRGSCSFASKVANAQAAGAVGAIIANNVPKGLPSMGGSDPSIVIPSLGVTQAAGDAIKAALAGGGDDDSDSDSDGVEAEFAVSDSVLAGTAAGKVRLYAPDPVRPGSSGSHWDITATPNLIMEPFINTDLESATTLDLSPNLLEDEGWVLLSEDDDDSDSDSDSDD